MQTKATIIDDLKTVITKKQKELSSHLKTPPDIGISDLSLFSEIKKTEDFLNDAREILTAIDPEHKILWRLLTGQIHDIPFIRGNVLYNTADLLSWTGYAVFSGMRDFGEAVKMHDIIVPYNAVYEGRKLSVSGKVTITRFDKKSLTVGFVGRNKLTLTKIKTRP